MSAMQKGNKHEGYTNNTSEGLDGTFYSAFYYIHFKYGLKPIVIEIHSLKTLAYFIDFFLYCPFITIFILDFFLLVLCVSSF